MATRISSALQQVHALPRDRAGTFEPQLVKKHDRQLAAFDEKILAMYAKGMTTRDIQELVKQLYGIDISASFVSQIRHDIEVQVRDWQLGYKISDN